MTFLLVDYHVDLQCIDYISSGRLPCRSAMYRLHFFWSIIMAVTITQHVIEFDCHYDYMEMTKSITTPITVTVVYNPDCKAITRSDETWK